MKKSQVTESITNISAYPHTYTLANGDPERPYTVGYAATKSGIVGVYMQFLRNEHTRLTFVHRGRQWSRTYARTFTDRGLLSVAGRFAREIVETEQ